MSRRISCPNCGKQLSVRPELAGKKVVCPRCSTQFRYAASDDEPTSIVEVAPPNPNLFPPNTQATTREAPTSGSAGHPARSASAPARASQSPSAKTDQSRVPPGSSPNGPQIAAPPPTNQRDRSQTARFIQRDVNETKVQLGEDGQLPDLALAKRDRGSDSAGESNSSNPWLLVAVLSMSVVLSLLILLVEPPGPVRSRTQADARQQVEVIFASWDRADESALEVRDLLASALQAHNRGDNEEEREYYRQVLDYLNREDAPKYGGFSGNDKLLKELLNELLR